MKKITINLSPFKKQEASPLTKALNPHIPLILLVLAIFILLNVLVFTLANIFNVSLISLENTHKNLSPSVKDVQTLKDTLAAQIKEKKDYQTILVPEIQLARILADTYAAVPKNVWLKSLTFDKNSLALEGSVVKWKEESMATLDKFIKDLNKQTYFVSVFKNSGLKNYKKNKIQNTETIDFALECSH